MFPSLPPAWVAVQVYLSTLLGQPLMLAGGALRDLYAGKPEQTKDLDFWTDLPPAMRVLLKAVLKKQGWTPHGGCYLGYTDSKLCDRGLNAIDWWITPDGLEVNIIWVTSAHPVSLLQSFDFGINQAVYDGAKWFTTETFLSDHANKCITLIRTQETAKRLKERVDRMLAKYPDYRLEFDWESIHEGSR